MARNKNKQPVKPTLAEEILAIESTKMPEPVVYDDSELARTDALFEEQAGEPIAPQVTDKIDVSTLLNAPVELGIKAHGYGNRDESGVVTDHRPDFVAPERRDHGPVSLTIETSEDDIQKVVTDDDLVATLRADGFKIDHQDDMLVFLGDCIFDAGDYDYRLEHKYMTIDLATPEVDVDLVLDAESVKNLGDGELRVFGDAHDSVELRGDWLQTTLGDGYTISRSNGATVITSDALELK